MNIVSWLLLTMLVVQGYVIFNMLNKLEFYESQFDEFYQRLALTLRNMRIIDERQMFESDDEVGEVFDQINDMVKELGNLLYEDIEWKDIWVIWKEERKH